MIAVVVKTAQDTGLAGLGDLVVIIGGVPFGIGGQTNFLKVLRIGEGEQP